ncbi:hypothetical protein GUITHDRAFT_160766 [Guillardia theta CCMP2712]|uniref:Uncharacterized protein n=2 Tax=Guillardia theta TaxID=55529 RepID=L1K033_GUITC|nr:hypothetical protein GUITHDRAFT_160766 [Guillardia theta CCMP2712]EKX53982.1 hypothetical protein GUITHDRAFT_160766 [Guillardia theta CCMP2712]|eukprot:XP_005840962.1 hypothetical protein GUITHDRAFT_160766 [Guillardia theta CCMP2712]
MSDGTSLREEGNFLLSSPPSSCVSPPCSPNVFSKDEFSKLSRNMRDGKAALPPGDEAVQDAMAAVLDAKTNLQGMPEVSKSTPAIAAPVQQNVAFQSQWAQMHGGASAKYVVKTSGKENKFEASEPPRAVQQKFTSGKDWESKQKEPKAAKGSTSGEADGGSKTKLLKAMEHMSKEGLQKLLRILIESKSARGSGSGGEQYEGINALLHREEDADRHRQANELHAVREVMDDLVERMKRRRQEEREDRDIMKSLASRLREPSRGKSAGRHESKRSEDLEILSRLLRSRSS